MLTTCGLVWNCTDIMPSLWFDEVTRWGIEPRRRTYAACARALLADIREQLQADREQAA
jgi:hypothetical protein